jgi:2-amino-4-hydroxy-6-hydroxymethyldihydropteridine diphosphokinase
VRAGPDPVLPHPGLADRPFVLYPLREIAPGLAVPGLGTVDALCARFPPPAPVVPDDWPR